MKTIKEFRSISEAYEAGYIKVGITIKTDADGDGINQGFVVEGIIGEIDKIKKTMWIWSNDKQFNGASGEINQQKHGFEYSWEVDLENDKDSQTEIEINTPDPKPIKIPKGLNNKEALMYLMTKKCK
jgi:hypothetical protein